MKYIRFLYFFIAINSTFIFAQDFWENCQGPFAANVLDISISNSEKIYISNYFNGIHRSSDFGNSWELVIDKLPQGYASKILINNKNYIFASIVGHGLYRSTDDGNSWHVLTNFNYGSINTFLLLSYDTINACTYNGLFRSIDDGETWQSMTSNLTNIWATTFARNLQRKIFIGSYNGSVYISGDEGETWDSSQVSNYPINCISININDNIIIGTENGVYRSSDSGQTWELLNNGLPQEEIYLLETNSIGYIYSVTENGFFYSFNNGENWYEINHDANYIGSLSIDSSDNIYIGSRYWGRGMYKSTDHGFNWEVINKGIRNSFVTSLAQSVNGTIWAGTWGTGLFYSLNNGADWNYSGFVNKKINSIKIDSINNIFIATSDGVYLSEDNGYSWIDKSSGISITRVETLIIIDSCIYVGTFGGGLYQSCNKGDTWVRISNNLLSQTIYTLAELNNYILCGTSQGIFKTSDYGNNWEEIFSIRPQTIFVNSNNDVYVGTVYDGAFVSRDSGQTWNSLVENGFYASDVGVFERDLVGNLYAGTYFAGIYVSHDNGNVWNKLNKGLPYKTVNSLLTTSDGYIFAGTVGGGTYKSIEPITSVESKQDIFSIKNFLLSQNYPNPFNPISKIKFVIPREENVKIEVFDVLGNHLMTLIDEFKTSGEYEVEINGEFLSSGVYFYSIKAGKFFNTKKFVLLK